MKFKLTCPPAAILTLLLAENVSCSSNRGLRASAGTSGRDDLKKDISGAHRVPSFPVSSPVPFEKEDGKSSKGFLLRSGHDVEGTLAAALLLQDDRRGDGGGGGGGGEEIGFDPTQVYDRGGDPLRDNGGGGNNGGGGGKLAFDPGQKEQVQVQEQQHGNGEKSATLSVSGSSSPEMLEDEGVKKSKGSLLRPDKEVERDALAAARSLDDERRDGDGSGGGKDPGSEEIGEETGFDPTHVNDRGGDPPRNDSDDSGSGEFAVNTNPKQQQKDEQDGDGGKSPPTLYVPPVSQVERSKKGRVHGGSVDSIVLLQQQRQQLKQLRLQEEDDELLDQYKYYNDDDGNNNNDDLHDYDYLFDDEFGDNNPYAASTDEAVTSVFVPLLDGNDKNSEDELMAESAPTFLDPALTAATTTSKDAADVNSPKWLYDLNGDAKNRGSEKTKKQATHDVSFNGDKSVHYGKKSALFGANGVDGVYFVTITKYFSELELVEVEVYDTKNNNVALNKVVYGSDRPVNQDEDSEDECFFSLHSGCPKYAIDGNYDTKFVIRPFMHEISWVVDLKDETTVTEVVVYGDRLFSTEILLGGESGPARGRDDYSRTVDWRGTGGESFFIFDHSYWDDALKMQKIKFTFGPYIKIPPATDLGSFSMAMWVYLIGDPGQWTRIIDFGSVRHRYGGLVISPKHGRCNDKLGVDAHGKDNAELYCLCTSITLSQDAWHHIALTYEKDGVGAKLYLNGEKVGSDPYNDESFDSWPSDMAIWFIGRSNWNRDPLFSGRMEDIRIYDGVLSPDDIMSLFASPTGAMKITSKASGHNDKVDTIKPTISSSSTWSSPDLNEVFFRGSSQLTYTLPQPALGKDSVTTYLTFDFTPKVFGKWHKIKAYGVELFIAGTDGEKTYTDKATSENTKKSYRIQLSGNDSFAVGSRQLDLIQEGNRADSFFSDVAISRECPESAVVDESGSNPRCKCSPGFLAQELDAQGKFRDTGGTIVPPDPLKGKCRADWSFHMEESSTSIRLHGMKLPSALSYVSSCMVTVYQRTSASEHSVVFNYDKKVIPKNNLINGIIVDGLVSGRRHFVEVVPMKKENGELVEMTASKIIESAVTHCSCSRNDDPTGAPSGLTTHQENGYIFFEWNDRSQCEEGFSLSRRSAGSNGAYNIFKPNVAVLTNGEKGENCPETTIVPGEEAADDLRVSRLQVGTSYEYCVAATAPQYMHDPSSESAPTLKMSASACSVHKITWEASISGRVTLSPSAGSHPVRDAMVSWELLDIGDEDKENPTALAIGSSTTGPSGHFSITFNVVFDLLNDEDYPVRVRASKTTDAGNHTIQHRFLCDNEATDCTNKGTLVYLRHLDFEEPLRFIDATSVPIRGKIVVAETDQTHNDDMRLESNSGDGCILQGIDVCLKQKHVQTIDTDDLCVQSESDGTYELPATIGTTVTIEVRYKDHTFAPLDRHASLYEHGILVEPYGDNDSHDFKDTTVVDLIVEVAGGLCNHKLGESTVSIKMPGRCGWRKNLKQPEYRQSHRVPAQLLEVRVTEIIEIIDGKHLLAIETALEDTVNFIDLRDLKEEEEMEGQEGDSSNSTEASESSVLPAPSSDLNVAKCEEADEKEIENNGRKVRFQYDGELQMQVSFIGDDIGSTCGVGNYTTTSSCESLHVMKALTTTTLEVTLARKLKKNLFCDIVKEDLEITLTNELGTLSSYDKQFWGEYPNLDQAKRALLELCSYDSGSCPGRVEHDAITVKKPLPGATQVGDNDSASSLQSSAEKNFLRRYKLDTNALDSGVDDKVGTPYSSSEHNGTFHSAVASIELPSVYRHKEDIVATPVADSCTSTKKKNAHIAEQVFLVGPPNRNGDHTRSLYIQADTLLHRACVIVTGDYKLKEVGSFGLPTHQPILVLRDPPGGLSYATYENVETSVKLESTEYEKYVGFDLDFGIGLKVESETDICVGLIGFACNLMLNIEKQLQAKTGGGKDYLTKYRNKQDSGGFTSTWSYQTSDNPWLAGSKSDAFLVPNLDVKFSQVDTFTWKPSTCELDERTDYKFNLEALGNKPALSFVTRYDLETYEIPLLENINASHSEKLANDTFVDALTPTEQKELKDEQFRVHEGLQGWRSFLDEYKETNRKAKEGELNEYIPSTWFEKWVKTNDTGYDEPVPDKHWSSLAPESLAERAVGYGAEWKEEEKKIMNEVVKAAGEKGYKCRIDCNGDDKSKCIKNCDDKYDLLSGSWTLQEISTRKKEKSIKNTHRIKFSGGGGMMEFSLSHEMMREAQEKLGGPTDNSVGRWNLGVGMEFGLTFMGLGLGLGLDSDFHVETSASHTMTNTQEKETSISFVLGDDEESDRFSVDIYIDPRYGTFIFATQGGQSRCPHEEGTMAVGAPKISLVKWPTKPVLPIEWMIFNLELVNEGADMASFELIVDNNNGILDVDYRFDTDRFDRFGANEATTAVFAVKKGPSDFIHDPFKITLRQVCEGEAGTTGYYSDIGHDSVEVYNEGEEDNESNPPRIEFARPCPMVEWAGDLKRDRLFSFNQEDEKKSLEEIPIVVFNPQYSEGSFADLIHTTRLKHVHLWYRQVGSLDWEQAIDVGEEETKQVDFLDPSMGSIEEEDSYGYTAGLWKFGDGGVQDGSYEIMVETKCETIIGAPDEFNFIRTPPIRGVIDRQEPKLFGLPRPYGNHVQLGEPMYFAFSEDVGCEKPYRFDFDVSLWITSKIEQKFTNDNLLITCNRNEISFTFDGTKTSLKSYKGKEITGTLNNVVDLVGNGITEPVVFEKKKANVNLDEASTSFTLELEGANCESPLSDGNISALRDEIASFAGLSSSDRVEISRAVCADRGRRIVSEVTFLPPQVVNGRLLFGENQEHHSLDAFEKLANLLRGNSVRFDLGRRLENMLTSETTMTVKDVVVNPSPDDILRNPEWTAVPLETAAAVRLDDSASLSSIKDMMSAESQKTRQMQNQQMQMQQVMQLVQLQVQQAQQQQKQFMVLIGVGFVAILTFLLVFRKK